MPIVQGFISVTDLVDGVVGNAVIFTNENHTYVADADGLVTAGEISMYTNDAFVDAGSVSITYEPDTDLVLDTNNTFTIASSIVSGQTYRRATGITVTPSGADVEVRLTGASGDSDVTFAIVDAGTANTTGFFDAGGTNSVVITVPVAVRTNAGTVTYNKTISLSKAVGGSAPYVRMTSSDQTVEYDYLGSTPKTGQANIVLNALAFNTPASVGSGANTGVWFYSNDNSTYTALDGTESGVTITGANSDDSSLTITTTAFNTFLSTNRRVIFRYVRQAGANVVANHEIFDQISVFRVDDAESGYTTYIEVAGGTTAFKNGIAYNATDAATYADLVARVYGANDTEITSSNTSSLSYQWTKNGVDLTATDVNLNQAAQDALNANGFAANTRGVTKQALRINAADVADNGADVFGCTVNFVFSG